MSTRAWATKNHAAIEALRAALEEGVARPESLRFWIEVSREQRLVKGEPDPASLIAP